MTTLHLLTTTRCLRNCKHCCNNQIDLNSVPYVDQKDFQSCEIVCLTGGEPILYCNVVELSKKIKLNYPNIKNIYVYANAFELSRYKGGFDYIDGISISIKSLIDVVAFNELKNDERLLNLKSNRVYVFDHLINKKDIPNKWKYIKRTWQEDFEPANNSIFRKLKCLFG